MFRCKDSACAEKIANDMQWACDNPKIGYDQKQRNSLYNVSKPYGFDCQKVKTKCETDCSALVRVCCAYAGIMLKPFNTSNEVTVLLDSGCFVELLNDKYTTKPDYLMRGDILVTKTKGHTVIVLTNGDKAQPEILDYDKIMVTAKSVFIRKLPDKMSLAVGVGYMGDEFPLVSVLDGWSCIIYKGEKRYVTNKYTIPVYSARAENENPVT